MSTSTEFISLDQPPKNGPHLPFDVHDHAMVQVDPNTIYIIGGIQRDINGSSENRTWIVNPKDNFKIMAGPNLNMGRSQHAAAVMKINGDNWIVVTGGFSNSVELLDISKKGNSLC